MRGRFKDYEHVARLAAIAAVALLGFLLVRWWLVPADFGLYGHYRAGAIADNRARPLAFAGRAACVDCHASVVDARRGGAHERVGCEACHGPLALHAAGRDDTVPARPDARITCVRCHDARAGKPRAFKQVDVNEHAPEGACSACHQPHQPAIQ